LSSFFLFLSCSFPFFFFFFFFFFNLLLDVCKERSFFLTLFLQGRGVFVVVFLSRLFIYEGRFELGNRKNLSIKAAWYFVFFCFARRPGHLLNY